MLDLDFIKEEPSYFLKGHDKKVAFLEEMLDELKDEALSNEGMSIRKVTIRSDHTGIHDENISVLLMETEEMLYRADPRSVSFYGILESGMVPAFWDLLTKGESFKKAAIIKLDKSLYFCVEQKDTLFFFSVDCTDHFAKVTYTDTCGQPKELTVNVSVATPSTES
jgi:hypothetical protein